MKKRLIYTSLNALEPVKKILREVDEALNDKSKTLKTSTIPEMLGAVAGGAVGVGAGIAMVSAAGVTGLSAAGLTSGLATLGGIVGGTMLGGIFVAGAPMAVLGVSGYALVSHRNRKRLKQTKEAILQEILRKHDAIIRELNRRINLSEERAKYLEALNILLLQITKDLEADLRMDQAA